MKCTFRITDYPGRRLLVEQTVHVEFHAGRLMEGMGEEDD